MQKKVAIPALVLVLTIGAISALAGTPQRQARLSMLVQTNWLAAHLSDKNLVILHVGTDRSAYDARHIPGARFLNFSAIAVTRNGIPNELPPLGELKAVFEGLGVADNSRVVLYGERAGLLAARAWFTLDYLGRGDGAALLDGGMEQWTAEHRPVSTAFPAVTRATLTVRARPQLIAEMADVKQIVARKKVALVDARPPSDYAANRIPGAVNVFWGDTIVSPQMPRLKPVSDIRARYASAGLSSGSEVVVYCQTGIQAAHDYFTLKLAGFRPVLYDGSFIEWSRATGQ